MCDSVAVVAASPGRTTRSRRAVVAIGRGEKERDGVYQQWSAGPAPAPERPLDRPVWVDLDQLYGTPDENVAGVDDPPPGGWLKASGRVPGVLKRWRRAIDGRWFGCRPGLELTVDLHT
jgi:hypothetical protein